MIELQIALESDMESIETVLESMKQKLETVQLENDKL